jgi:hypothetical protein
MKNFVQKVLVITALLMMGVVFPSAAQDHGLPSDTESLRSASYDGIWAGTLKCLYDPGLWPEDECDMGLMLEISGTVLKVKTVVRTKKVRKRLPT